MSRPPFRPADTGRLGMWLFLLSEMLLFGGLFLLYAVYLSRYPLGFAAAARELDLVPGAANTAVLLTSSLLAAAAVTAASRGDGGAARALLLGTVLCSALFLGIKAAEWGGKFHHGLWPGSPRLLSAPPGWSVFFSLYFVTTGLHALHVLAGAGLLGGIAARVGRGPVGEGDAALLENGALYWHLVDLVWIFIFPLYYLVL